jgi:peptide/nickel transport system substrate-binding protein
VARALALAVAIVVSLLAVSGAGGAATQQTPKHGGTVVIAMPQHLEPACLRPPLLRSCDAGLVGPDLFAQILVGAYRDSPDGWYRPGIASGTIVSRQPLTILYRIRPEARWSDGVPVTARDFEYTHRAVMSHGRDDAKALYARVRSVRARGAKVVRVVLAAPYADWRELFRVVLPRHALEGEELETLWRSGVDNPRTGAAIGSGPFLVERFERGRQLVLRRNPRYWGEHTAYLDRLVYRFIAPETAAEALRRGEVDMIDPGPRVMASAALELSRQRPPGITIVPLVGTGVEHFDIRMRGPGGHPALRVRAVRQALAYGIDREQIARAAAAHAGQPDARAQPVDSMLFLESTRYYEPNWEGYRYRPQHARRLLEQAGCRRGSDGIYVCGGERLSLRFLTAAAIDLRRRTIELTREQLLRIGVEVVPQYFPPGVLSEALQRRDFDVFQFAWFVGATTTGWSSVFGCQQDQNFTGYCDRLVTRDLNRVERVLDDGRRARLLNGIDARLAKAVPVIPLYRLRGLFAFDAQIRGIVRNALAPFTWNAEDWWLEQSR